MSDFALLVTRERLDVFILVGAVEGVRRLQLERLGPLTSGKKKPPVLSSAVF